MFDEGELYPVTRITAGAVGEPGRRVFILQAHVEGHPVTWVIEKRQASTLSRALSRLLARVQTEYPELGEPLVAARPNLSLAEPLEPMFRVGGIAVDYDRVHDLVVITLVDADADELEDADPDAEEMQSDLQIYTTRGQALLLSRQAELAVSAGRPSCPDCGEPIDDFGHFCLPPSARWKASSDLLQ